MRTRRRRRRRRRQIKIISNEERTYLLLKVGQNLGDDSVQSLGDLSLGKIRRERERDTEC